jgi:hypothetical protein
VASVGAGHKVRGWWVPNAELMRLIQGDTDA